MDNSLWLILTTVETKDQAKTIARSAIEKKLAACVQITPEVHSFFNWDGQFEESIESRIYFKASSRQKEALLDWLKGSHPYEVPGIFSWQVDSADPAYTEWVNAL